jgi:ABC-type hemin transport system ATPase subunit
MASLPGSLLDRRPIVVALAGPNGAGKTTFYHAHLRAAGLRLVNADVLARELKMAPYAAARVAGAIREELIRQRETRFPAAFFELRLGLRQQGGALCARAFSMA